MSRYTLNDTYDDLALTFSTDWLYTHWPVYGLGLNEKKKVKLQAGCRLIVEDMLFIDPKLKASQYWHKSYAPQRIDKTKNLFVDLLNSLNLNEFEKQSATAIFCAKPVLIDQLKLFEDITELFFEQRLDAKPILDPEIEDHLREAWSASLAIEEGGNYVEDFDSRSLYLAATSSWDFYVQRLLTDIPEYIGDLLYGSAVSKIEYAWRLTDEKLSPRQRIALLTWYRSLAVTLTGEDLLGDYLSVVDFKKGKRHQKEPIDLWEQFSSQPNHN